jgi:Iron-containing alcohol dehydrogenase
MPLRDGALAGIGDVLARIRARRLFLVVDEAACAASGAEKVLEPFLRDRTVTRFNRFELNPKLHDVERGIAEFRAANADAVVSLGGGTAIDLGKLIRALACQEDPARDIIIGDACIRRVGPPLIAVPTTAGTGSEATHFAVVYVDGEKHSVADASLLPDYAIIDPTLTHSLPALSRRTRDWMPWRRPWNQCGVFIRRTNRSGMPRRRSLWPGVILQPPFNILTTVTAWRCAKRPIWPARPSISQKPRRRTRSHIRLLRSLAYRTVARLL